jgi:hypothetical protein
MKSLPLVDSSIEYRSQLLEKFLPNNPKLQNPFLKFQILEIFFALKERNKQTKPLDTRNEKVAPCRYQNHQTH